MAPKMTLDDDDWSQTERQRLLAVIRDLVPSIPQRPLREVERELAAIRAARRGGNRRESRGLPPKPNSTSGR